MGQRERKNQEWIDAHNLVSRGEQRDEIASERPQGCRCLGAGGDSLAYFHNADGIAIAVFINTCDYCEEGLAEQERKVMLRSEVEAFHVRQAISGVWRAAGIPDRFLDFRLDSHPLAKSQPELIARIKAPEWTEETSDVYDAWRTSWYFWGPVGSGKTGLAIGYAWEYLTAEFDVGELEESSIVFRTVPEVLLELRSSFNRKEGELTEHEVFQRLREATVLILDDMGTEHVRDKEWLEEVLLNIIGWRHDHNKQVVITSNASPAEIQAKIGERLGSRIFEMCGADHIIKVAGDNLRYA